MRVVVRWLPVWLTTIATLAAPPAARFATSSSIVAFVVGVLSAAALAWLVVGIAPTLRLGLIGAGVAVVVVAGTGVLGASQWQRTALLVAGRTLQDATPADAVARAEEAAWVRLVDARVDRASIQEHAFVRGDRSKPAQQTRSTIGAAPIAGTNGALWACTSSRAALGWWLDDQGPIRGALARMDDHVVAATGAPAGAWCVELDPQRDAAAARASAVALAASLLVVLPLFLLAVVAIILAPATPKR